MIIIPIRDPNLIMTLNDGVFPQPEINECGGVEPTYLVLEPRKKPRVINHDAFLKIDGVKTVVRKFHYAP